MIQALDAAGCRRLAEVVGDEATWSIMVHALLTGRGRAYVIGSIERFEAAMVFPDYCANEPYAWGDPAAIWRIASQIPGWTAIEMPCEVAPPVAKLARDALQREVDLVDDIFYVREPNSGAPPRFEHPAVRMLEMNDADLQLLTAAPKALSGGDLAYARRMLSEAFYAAAIVDGRIVGRVEAYARSPRYANLGVIVLPEFRRQGIAVAAASLVTAAVLAAGQTASWSTGATNVASQNVAKKLGFREIARSTYVVPA